MAGLPHRTPLSQAPTCPKRPLLKSAIAWRISASAPGDYDVAVQLGAHWVTKRVRVSGDIVSRSAVRPDGSFVQQLLHPAESPVSDDSPVESITVTYPQRDMRVWGYAVHWLVVFAGFTVVFALALARPFGVVL